MSYEALLLDKEKELVSLLPFVTGREEKVTETHVQRTGPSEEAQRRAGKSAQWKNLTRGKSLEAEQVAFIYLPFIYPESLS